MLSVVIPVYNEEEVLAPFYRRLVEALADLSGHCEILFVDDGSTDSTRLTLEAIRKRDPIVGVARLTRNFGKEGAISAGLQLARGLAVVIIADLQNPPEQIVRMVQAWQAGAEVVNMRRCSPYGESSLKKGTASIFYRAINLVREVPIAQDVGDFRLLSRRAVEALNSLPERCRFMKGMFSWIGFDQVTLDYDRHARLAGKTPWRYWCLWNYARDGRTSFSTPLLKFSLYAGFISAVGAFVYALYFLSKVLIIGEPVQEFPTFIVTMLLVGGLQLLAIGIVGEYVGRLHIEVKQRPRYLLDDYQPALMHGAQTGGLAS